MYSGSSGGGGHHLKSNINLTDSSPSGHHQPVNEAIKSPAIILIDEKGTRLGQRQLKDVLQSLDRRAFSLVQVGTAPAASTANIPADVTSSTSTQDLPICKIFSRQLLVEQQRKLAEQDKRQRRQNREKEIRFNETISEHDLLIKMRHMRELLMKGYHIRVVQVGKKQRYARHVTQPELDRQKMELIREHLCAKPTASEEECEYACGAKIEAALKVLGDGISLSMTLGPPSNSKQ
jgi:translation initiation factor IF-3